MTKFQSPVVVFAGPRFVFGVRLGDQCDNDIHITSSFMRWHKGELTVLSSQTFALLLKYFSTTVPASSSIMMIDALSELPHRPVSCT